MKIDATDPDIESIMRRIDDDIIDLQPDFQRDFIWSKKKQQCLIDTVLREWKFPPVYLVSDRAEDRSDVLDGQQRLQAIRSFIQGGFPVDGEIEPRDEKIINLSGLYFKDLPLDVKNRFLRYSIRVHSLYDYTSEEPYELFFRLNQGSMLTPAEKRNTLFGEFRDQVRKIVSYMESDFGVNSQIIGFNNSRLSYHDVISRLLYLIKERSIERKITDSDLVDVFRSEVGVSPSDFELAYRSVGYLFSDISSRVRFNKATFLTWLTFYAVEDCRSPGLMEQFELDRAGMKSGQSSLLASDLDDWFISIYQDKSSSSVNDAVPVQLRLLCVYFYAISRGILLNSNKYQEAKIIYEKFGSESRSEERLVGLMCESRWGAL